MARKSRREKTSFVGTTGRTGKMLPQVLDTLTKPQLRDILVYLEDVKPRLIVEALEELWFDWYGTDLDEDQPVSLWLGY